MATGLGFVLHKFNQPTIVAYLLTGFMLGPAVFGVVGQSEFIALLSELGLAFLLFFLGIEMNVSELDELLKPLIRITALQRLMQVSVVFAVVSWFGFDFLSVFIISVATVFGATPVIVKLLNDTGDLNTLPGRINVGVLVFQDIYVVLLLALLSADNLTRVSTIGFSVLKILGLIGAIGGLAYFASRFVIPDVFKRVSRSQHAFFIHGLAWAFLFITLSELLGLPIEIGAFLAGLALGQMQFQGELKERVRPLTVFFMVVFFSSIGLQLSWANLVQHWHEALITGGLLMVGNALIMYYLIRRESFSPKTSFIAAVNMTQASEFTLVAGGVAVAQDYVSGDILGFLSIMALVTMILSAFIINYNRELYDYASQWLPPGDDDGWVDSRDDHTVIVGFDDTVRSLLSRFGENTLIVDNNAEHVAELQASNTDYLYGDFFHEEMRGEADVEAASLVISVIPSMLISKHVLRDADEATVIVKAMNEDEAAELYEMGADYVIVKEAVMAERLGDLVEAWQSNPAGFNAMKHDEKRRVNEVAR